MTNKSILQVKIVNVETGEEVIRDMNEAELAQYETDKAVAVAAAEARLKAQADKAALLIRLGLTEDELKTILG